MSMADLPIPARETERLLAIALLRAEQAERERDEARELALARGDDAISRALERDEARETIRQMQKEIDDTQAALLGLREAADAIGGYSRHDRFGYVQHRAGCRISPTNQTCTCGMREADDGLGRAIAATPAALADQVRARMLRALSEDQAALETARKAIEDTLVEWRESRLSEPLRGNGLVIKESDGTHSHVIRFGPETAMQVGLRALAAAAEKETP